ncbi:MAG: DUF3576 domain-containing protein [Alphaproteobacteria bacterium]|nr:DUF3576 domain-containing protein [Alphaproteobacteria bacterium]
MRPFHYRLLPVLAATLSLTAAGCGTSGPRDETGAVIRQQKAASADTGEMDTEATLWTVLGLAKEPSRHDPGPHTGDLVSPILWQATHDTLDFVAIASEDPLTGALATDWYSPRGKPNERMRINVFILARALRSDSLAVTIERQERKPGGPWQPSTVERQAQSDLETAILLRARQIRRTLPAAS